MRYGFVYETTNLETDMKYIGKHKRSQNPDDPDDCDYLGSGKYLDRAVEKYGRDKFSRRIICECDSEQELQEMERYYIAESGAVNSNMYYNLVPDANPPVQTQRDGELMRGRKQVHRGEDSRFILESQVDEYISSGWELGSPSRQRKAQSARAKKRLVDTRNHPMYGKHHTEESLKKMSDNHADFSGENHPMYGKHHTEESLKKMSDSHIGKPNLCREYHLTCKSCGKEFIASWNSYRYCDNCR